MPEKTNLKPIPPTIRGKKRYILFSMGSERHLNENDVSAAIWKSVLKLFGEKGAAEMKPWLVLWNRELGRGILRCSHSRANDVREALMFIKEAGSSRVQPGTLLVSGSMAKLKKQLEMQAK